MTATNATSTRSGPLLVGRGREQAQLLVALRGTSAGAACIALVRGRSGIGKSALLAAVAREAETRERALVLVGRCHEFETVPFKGLDGVIDSLSRHLKASSSEELGRLLPPDLGDLATIFPVLRRIAPIASAYARRSTAERTVQRIRAAGLACLREILRRIAEGTPLLVLIDDVQWADEDTSRALVELLKDQHPPAMLLLLGSRPDDSTPVIAELFSTSGGRAVIEAARVTVDLEPLDETATLALIRAELHAGARGDVQAMMHDDLVATLAREARGNPFAACELARFVREEEGDFEAGVVGRSIDEIVVKRADGLDAAARELLDVIAVSGEPTDDRVLRRAAGLSADDRASTDTLRSKLWIRGLRSGSATLLDAVHDRVRESIASVLPAPRKAAIHGALALALESTEAPAHDRLARHFAAAGEASLAHHHALVASEEARASLALRRSADLLGLAIELATDAQRAELMPRYAQSLADAGLFERCAEAWDRAADLATGTERHAHRRRAAEAWLYAGRIDHGLDLLERIAGKTGLRIAKNRYLALAQTLWQRIVLRLRGFSTRPRALSDIPPRELERLDTLRAMSIAYYPIDIVRGAMLHARWLRAALDAGHIVDVQLALMFEFGVAAIAVSQRGGDRARDAIRQLPTVSGGLPTEFVLLLLDVMWAGLVEGGQTAEAQARRLQAASQAIPLPEVFRSLEHYTIALAVERSLHAVLHEPRMRFVQQREEAAGPFAEIRLRVFETNYRLLQGRPEVAVRRGGQEAWQMVCTQPLLFTAVARCYESWSLLYLADIGAALDVARDALRLSHLVGNMWIAIGRAVALTHLCCAALAAGRCQEVIDHAKQLRGTRAPLHHGYRTHLEALAALAGRGDPVAKLRALADHGQRYGIEQTEGTALWALGTLRPGPGGAADRARLLELIADTGLVDPDRYFWSLMPIGEPPPRRGTTTAIWADPAPGASA